MSATQSRQLLDWQVVEAILRGSNLTALYGPPGTGKTTAAVNAAQALGLTAWNVTLTDETPAAELRGHYLPTGEAWIWHDGPALTAYRSGGVLVLNEIDHASGDALDFCHNLLDDPGVSRITLPSGEVVFPHRDFRVVMTFNGEPGELPEALQDRACIMVYIDTPHPDAIAALPDDLQEIARQSAGRDDDDARPATLRRWKAYAALRESTDENTALVAVFAHRADEIRDALTLGASR